MAVLRANTAIDTRQFEYIAELVAGDGVYRNDGASRFTITDGPNVELRFDGTGFVYGSDSQPDGGIITRVRARYDEDGAGTTTGFATVWDLQGLDLRVTQLYDLVAQGPEAVVAHVFAGADQLYGSAENDTLQGHGGNDSYFGSLGNDTYYFDDAGDRVVSLTDDGLDILDEGFDTILASVNARVSGGAERLILTGEEDITATGSSNADRLLGNSGDNVINGRRGNDLLWGKEGNDTFTFDTSGTAHKDRILDFTVGQDKIALDDTAFSELVKGTLKAAAFKDIGTGAKVDANDRVIYNSDYGTLFYDENGSAAGGRVIIAVLDGEPALKASDILVV